MFVLNTVILINSLFFVCHGSIVDTLNKNKCSIKDEKCLAGLYELFFKEYAKPGIPELNVPPFDPLDIKNISVKILDTITVTVLDGVGKGLSGCKFENFHLNLEKQIVSQEIICDITVKGNIAVTGSNQLLQSLLGEASINTQGKAKVKLDKIGIKYEVPINVIKKEDGETYLKVDIKKLKLSYDIEKVTFFAEKFFIGKNDISQLAVTYMNENWKTLVNNFGQTFVTKILDIYYVFIDNFFSGVPTKHFLIEDMSSYVDN